MSTLFLDAICRFFPLNCSFNLGSYRADLDLLQISRETDVE